MGDWIIAGIICSLFAFLLVYPFCKVAGEADRAMENIMNNYKNQNKSDEH